MNTQESEKKRKTAKFTWQASSRVELGSSTHHPLQHSPLTQLYHSFTATPIRGTIAVGNKKPVHAFASIWLHLVERTENPTQTELPNKHDSFVHVIESPYVGKTSGSVDPRFINGCEGPDFFGFFTLQSTILRKS